MGSQIGSMHAFPVSLKFVPESSLRFEVQHVEVKQCGKDEVTRLRRL